ATMYLRCLRAPAGPKNPAPPENQNGAPRARGPEPQPPLKQRSRRAFFLTNNFEAFFDELFIFRCYFFLWRTSGLELLMHGRIKCRRTLFRNKFYEPMNFIVRNQHPLRADETGSARREIKHVALSE